MESGGCNGFGVMFVAVVADVFRSSSTRLTRGTAARDKRHEAAADVEVGLEMDG